MRTNTEDMGKHSADCNRRVRSVLSSQLLCTFVWPCEQPMILLSVAVWVGLVLTVVLFHGAYGEPAFPTLWGSQIWFGTEVITMTACFHCLWVISQTAGFHDLWMLLLWQRKKYGKWKEVSPGSISWKHSMEELRLPNILYYSSLRCSSRKADDFHHIYCTFGQSFIHVVD